MYAFYPLGGSVMKIVYRPKDKSIRDGEPPVSKSSLFYVVIKATTDEQFLSQETRDFCLKRQKSLVCGRQRREIFLLETEMKYHV